MNDTIITNDTFEFVSQYAFQQADTTEPMRTIEENAPQTLHDSITYALDNAILQMREDPNMFFHGLLNSAIHFGLKLLAALVIYFIGMWLIKWVRRVLTKGFARRHTEPTIVSFVSSLVTITCTILLIIITIGTLGINTTSLAALLAAGGMAIGMAMSGTVQNFAGGIMILVFKPFKVGDFIEAQGFAGTVTGVSISATKLRTTDNREIVLPNGALSNGNIDNYSNYDLRRVDWEVSVEYGTDAQQCMDLLKEIVQADERVLSKESNEQAQDVYVALKSLNANDITFIVRAWVKASEYWDVRYDFNQRFYTELPKHGINFAFPQLDVKIKS